METPIIAQKIIPPRELEAELERMWNTLGKNTMRASLFNLIVYVSLSHRTDYYRQIVQRVIERFPCRVFFLSAEEDDKSYCKTAISLLFPNPKDRSVACDSIDIGVAGEDYRLVPSIILPHLLPDLPIYLLWAEDPSLNNLLFPSLKALATRMIFDSESTADLTSFSQLLLSYHQQKTSQEIADLNWARIDHWRTLFAKFFRMERWPDLKELQSVRIVYNGLKTEFFCHTRIKALYFQSWLASRLGWSWEKVEKEGRSFLFHYQSPSGPVRSSLVPDQISSMAPGAILSISIETTQQKRFLFYREPSTPHLVTLQSSSPHLCEIPLQFVFEKDPIGQSLVNEIFYKRTSAHFLEILSLFSQMEGGEIC